MNYDADCCAHINYLLYDVSIKVGILVTVFPTYVFGSLPSDVELPFPQLMMPLILEVDMLCHMDRV